MTKLKPWRLDLGVAGGFLVGAVLWWSAYEPGGGLLQNPQLLVVPAAFGALFVTLRNKKRRVGPFDPNTIARNRAGRR